MPDWIDVLEQVVHDRRSALVGYATLFTTDRSQAEDLVHDALVRTFAKPRDLTDVHTAEGYVRQVIRTTYLDHARKQRTWRSKAHLFTVPDDPATPEGSAAAVVDVRAALATLAPRERACAVLRYLDDLPGTEIASTLGLSLGAVKRYLSDATTHLRERLGPDVVPADGTLDPVPPTRSGRSAS